MPPRYAEVVPNVPHSQRHKLVVRYYKRWCRESSPSEVTWFHIFQVNFFTKKLPELPNSGGKNLNQVTHQKAIRPAAMDLTHRQKWLHYFPPRSSPDVAKGCLLATTEIRPSDCLTAWSGTENVAGEFENKGLPMFFLFLKLFSGKC